MNRNKKKFELIVIMQWIAVGVFAIISLAAESGNCTEIVVNSSSKVSGGFICLGDIATIQGNLALIERLEKVVVAKAPLPGRTRNIRKEYILAKLKLNKVDLSTICVNCPKQVSVTTEYVEFSMEDIEKIVRQKILKSMPWKQEWIKIESFLTKPVILPKGRISYTFSDHDKEDYAGRFYTEIFFSVNGVRELKTKASAYITVTAPVVVAGETLIERHSIIEPEDITTEIRNITYVTDKVFFDPDKIVGLRTRGKIEPGDMLKTRMVEIAPIVKKGDIVTIEVESAMFSISAPGRVMENGCKGDLISVSNLESHNRIYAIVKNSKVVEARY